MEVELPGSAGFLAQVMDTGEAFGTIDILQDPEFGQIEALRGCQAAYCVPLCTDQKPFGVLFIAHPQPDYFTRDRCALLNQLGCQAMIAIQNARKFQDMEVEKDRMQEVYEVARKKLARDLHDGPTQTVAALAMRVNFTRRLLKRDPQAAADELAKVEDLARRTTKEIRHMLFTLRPLVLEARGLVAALEAMVENVRETFNQRVVLELEPSVIKRLHGSKQAVVYYTTEEAIDNARKYSQAQQIWVRLKFSEDGVALLEIEDDGIGYDMNGVDPDYENYVNLRLVNIRERAEMVNGILSIDTAKGHGTRLRLLIPLTRAAVERLYPVTRVEHAAPV
jgi:signal transduction histidine kinase